MAAVAGRKVLLQILNGTEYATIGALTAKSLTINAEPIDVTTDDDTGWRALLEDTKGIRSVDIKADGILKSLTPLLGVADSEAALNLRFEVPGIADITGTFQMSSFEIGAELEEGTTFSAAFASSGQVDIDTPETA